MCAWRSAQPELAVERESLAARRRYMESKPVAIEGFCRKIGSIGRLIGSLEKCRAKSTAFSNAAVYMRSATRPRTALVSRFSLQLLAVKHGRFPLQGDAEQRGLPLG